MSGQWEIKVADGSSSNVDSMCGNPLANLADEIRSARERGCTVRITNPSSTTTQVVMECKGNNPGAQPVKMEANLVRRSPGSLTFDYKSSNERGAQGQMNRIGNC